MLGKSQKQAVGENALAVQAEGDVSLNVNMGMTVDEVRTIATATFREDFVKMLGYAENIAEARARKVLDDFLDRVQKENPNALKQANDPDFRYALYSAQKAHVRADDDNLEKLLIELLIQRSKEEKRNLLQIVLSDSIEVAARITDEQIASLTLIFLLRNTQSGSVVSFESFLHYADRLIQPFVDKISFTNASLSHMAFSGCGVVQITEATLARVISISYPGSFQNGVAPDDPIVQQIGLGSRSLLVASEHVPGNLQVFTRTVATLEETCAQMAIPVQDLELLKNIFVRGSMSHEQVVQRMGNTRLYLRKLFEIWDTSFMKKFETSSVGMAIALANIYRINPEFGEMSTWIN